MPASKFEAIPDDLEPDEILARAQASAREARAKLMARTGGPNMGFLRQREDGTTNLNILVNLSNQICFALNMCLNTKSNILNSIKFIMNTQALVIASFFGMFVCILCFKLNPYSL